MGSYCRSEGSASRLIPACNTGHCRPQSDLRSAPPPTDPEHVTERRALQEWVSSLTLPGLRRADAALPPSADEAPCVSVGLVGLTHHPLCLVAPPAPPLASRYPRSSGSWDGGTRRCHGQHTEETEGLEWQGGRRGR